MVNPANSSLHRVSTASSPVMVAREARQWAARVDRMCRAIYAS